MVCYEALDYFRKSPGWKKEVLKAREHLLSLGSRRVSYKRAERYLAAYWHDELSREAYAMEEANQHDQERIDAERRTEEARVDRWWRDLHER